MDASSIPNKAVMGVPNLGPERARKVATDAALIARSLAPKSSGRSSASFVPIWGDGWFGVMWDHPYIWMQEAGIKPFTMRSLAGKTVPMWVNDADGEIRRKNPKAKTRVTDDGRAQVLIFRKAAKHGQRKNVWRQEGGKMVRKSVPMSYPGAPGRIAVNRSQGIYRIGDIDPGAKNRGQIASGNVGVRWRHPGLRPSRFLARALYVAAVNNGFPVAEVNYLSRWNSLPQNSFAVLVHGG